MGLSEDSFMEELGIFESIGWYNNPITQFINKHKFDRTITI
jgi:hypothetical protein